MIKATTKLIECMRSDQHLKSCDNDGFCNNCGFQDDPKTAEEYLDCFGELIDDIAEDNDHLGTCLGIAFMVLCFQGPPYTGDPNLRFLTPAKTEWVDIVQIVFEHGIIDVRRNTLRLLSIRTLTRFDGT